MIIIASLKDIICTGVIRCLNKVYASEFVGKLTGNADTATSATKATQDESGNNIKSSYASSISISDHTITLKNKNGASLGTVTVPDNNTDTKVTQNAVTASSYTNWRPIVFGSSNSSTEGFSPSTVTDGTYTANVFSVQPSTGTLKATIFKGTLSGNATTATALTTSAGSATQPVYFSGGKPVVCTYTLGKSVPSNAVFTDTNTTNTTGSTNTSSKIFLVGATSQASAPVTYSHDTVYVGTDGCLYSNSTRVVNEVISSSEPSGQINNDYWLCDY